MKERSERLSSKSEDELRDRWCIRGDLFAESPRIIRTEAFLPRIINGDVKKRDNSIVGWPKFLGRGILAWPDIRSNSCMRSGEV